MRTEVGESSMVNALGGLWVWNSNIVKTLVAAIRENKWQVRRELENKMGVFAFAVLPFFYCIFISCSDNQKKTIYSLEQTLWQKELGLRLSLLPEPF